MSFYRIYRPQVINEIDNVAVREQLLLLLAKDKRHLPHAYLFTGPRGAGKTTAARVVAKLFNCTKLTKSGPCGKCDQCIAIAEGRNLDVLEIDAASNRGIDEIRQLRDAINLAPSSGSHKVYIIDEVHMLTTEAFNALLKTLEEPPAHAVFVLATTDPQKVPATIISRCIGISFHRATADELAHALRRIVTAEKISIDEDALALVAQSVDGSFRDAVKTLEQVSFHKGKITAEVVRSTVFLPDQSDRKKFLEALSQSDARGAIALVADMVNGGKDIKIFLTDVLAELERLLIWEIEGKKHDAWSSDRLRTVIEKLTEAYGMIRISPIPHLPVELAVVDICGDGDATAASIPSVMKPEMRPKAAAAPAGTDAGGVTLGLLTFEKLTEHWRDFIAELKPFNHSVAAVLRSARPKAVEHGIVTIEAFYPFHKDKLSEARTKDILMQILKKLFGEKVKVEIILGKK